MSLTEAIDTELRKWGIENPVNQSYHGWRCTYPEMYGPCDCYRELLDALWGAVSDWIDNSSVDNVYGDPA